MSDTVRKNLGSVTAYKYAVSKGYTGTEDEFAELMADYATVAEEAEESASEAAQSASDAEAYAKGTRNGSDVSSSDPAYHNNSKYYAEQAEGYADSAGTSATTATTKASEASASAASASGSAGTATTKAGEASTSAANASASASAAATSETNAAASAGTASTAATNAASSATAAGNAQTAAEAAQAAAEDAQEATEELFSIFQTINLFDYTTVLSGKSFKTSVGNYYAGQLQDSEGNIASAEIKALPNTTYKFVSNQTGELGDLVTGIRVVEFNNSGISTKVTWLSVGGTSFTTESTTCSFAFSTSSAENYYQYYMLYDAAIIPLRYYSFGEIDNVKQHWEIRLSKAEESIPDIVNKAPVISKSLSGSIVSFADGADMPLKSLAVGVDYVQSGTGDPSPTNIRPITGWTKAKVWRMGKNLINATGINHSSGSKGYVSYLKAGTYYIYQFTGNSSHNSYFFYSLTGASGTWTAIPTTDDGYAVAHRSSGSYSRLTNRFTLHQDCYFQLSISGNSNVAANPIDAMLTTDGTGYDSVPTDASTLSYKASMYEPYNGQEYEVTFPSSAGTVCGGTLDVKNGTLKVDKAMVDLGTLTYGKNSVTEGTMFRAPVEGMASGNNKAWFITSHYPHVNASARANKTASQSYQNNIDIIDNDYTSADDFKTAMSGAQLCYELATAVTYNLTPTDIHTLLGNNAIWADTGDVSLEYCADTKTYVGDTFVKRTDYASSAEIKAGTEQEKYIAPVNQDASAFYALAKAAGDTTQSASSNAVGTYTEEAKRAICAMIGVPYDEPFRLIKEITITEETRYVNILTDESSSAFSLTEAVVCLDNMVATGSGTAYIVANQEASASLTATTPVLNIPNVYYTSARSTMAHIETRGGRFFGRGLDNVPENYSRSNITSSRNAFGVALCNRITCIGIRSSNDHKFTSGKITVYGR